MWIVFTFVSKLQKKINPTIKNTQNGFFLLELAPGPLADNQAGHFLLAPCEGCFCCGALDAMVLRGVLERGTLEEDEDWAGTFESFVFEVGALGGGELVCVLLEGPWLALPQDSSNMAITSLI